MPSESMPSSNEDPFSSSNEYFLEDGEGNYLKWVHVSEYDEDETTYAVLWRSLTMYGQERLVTRHIPLSQLHEEAEALNNQIQQVSVMGSAAIYEALGIPAGETNDYSDMRERRLRMMFAFPQPQGWDAWGNNLDVRRLVTPQSIEHAEIANLYVDDESITDLIHSYTKNLPVHEDISKVLRDDDGLRFELGAYLLKKIDEIPYLPPRFYDEYKKNPDTPGYPVNLSSQEYAVLLALSMLDGTFKLDTAHSKHDLITFDKTNEVISGQHRYAALQILGLEHSTYGEIHFAR